MWHSRPDRVPMATGQTLMMTNLMIQEDRIVLARNAQFTTLIGSSKLGKIHPATSVDC